MKLYKNKTRAKIACFFKARREGFINYVIPIEHMWIVVNGNDIIFLNKNVLIPKGFKPLRHREMVKTYVYKYVPRRVRV